MASNFKKTILAILLLSPLFSIQAYSQKTISEKHLEVSLRMIGHQVLLSSGDSTSRVLPIIAEEERYIIQFESEFELSPDGLVNIVKEVVASTEISSNYIIEVEQCSTGEIVYSFEMIEKEQSGIIPCRARSLEKSCYNLIFTKLDDKDVLALNQSNVVEKSEEQTSRFWDGNSMYILFILLGLALLFFPKRKRVSILEDSNLISIGEYQFDKRNAELRLKDEKIELTGKEADLLLLLFNAANTTLERDVILNMVWGDEGDYIGRTLDVFISKLRKKLEEDKGIKIVNIRGVGYKLVINP